MSIVKENEKFATEVFVIRITSFVALLSLGKSVASIWSEKKHFHAPRFSRSEISHAGWHNEKSHKELGQIYPSGISKYSENKRVHPPYFPRVFSTLFSKYVVTLSQSDRAVRDSTFIRNICKTDIR